MAYAKLLPYFVYETGLVAQREAEEGAYAKKYISGFHSLWHTSNLMVHATCGEMGKKEKRKSLSSRLRRGKSIAMAPQGGRR